MGQKNAALQALHDVITSKVRHGKRRHRRAVGGGGFPPLLCAPPAPRGAAAFRGVARRTASIDAGRAQVGFRAPETLCPA